MRGNPVSTGITSPVGQQRVSFSGSGRALQMADPEKAILDLLYLYTGYNSAQDMEDLRLDEDFLHADLKKELTGHRDERFLIKVESQDQLVQYKPEIVNMKGCGFFFPMAVPSAGVLCAMKVAAISLVFIH
jgi:hypothetical protein